MADATVRDATRNQITIDYDRSRLLIRNNSFRKYNYANISGVEETVEVATLMGKVDATQKLVPCVAAAVNGSQIPVTVLMQELTAIAIAGTVDDVDGVNGGDIRYDAVKFNAAETWATTATDAGGVVKTLADWLILNSKDIEIVPVEDSSEFDN